MRFLDDVQQLEQEHRSAAAVSWAIARDPAFSADVNETLQRRGAARYIKAADVLLTTDPTIALHPANMAFAGQVNAESIIGKLLGATEFPLTEGGRLQVGVVTAEITAEGDEAQNASLQFDLTGRPSKAAVAGIFTNEALTAVDPVTQAGIVQTLVAASAAAMNRVLVSVFTGGTSTGSATVSALFGALDRAVKPYLVCGLGDALALAPGVLRDLQVAGVGLITSPEASGYLIAVDATGVLFSDAGVVIDLARHATIPLSFNGSPAVPTNLWQNNLTAIRVVRYVKFAVRAGAVAFAATVGSPSV
jgi:hypothetical protein